MKYKVQNTVNNEYLDDDVIFLLPNGEVGWFIRDGSYPHYRKFGHQEDFKVINEDCERLQKQLEIAQEALDYYSDMRKYNKSGWCSTDVGYKKAWEASLKIKELNK